LEEEEEDDLFNELEDVCIGQRSFDLSFECPIECSTHSHIHALAEDEEGEEEESDGVLVMDDSDGWG